MFSDYAIVPTGEEHVEGFHRCLDVVARERKYLAMIEAPPLESVRAFVRSVIQNNHVQVVALHKGEVVGWCDIIPRSTPGFQHCGELGMGVLPEHRGRGLGKRLAAEAILRAWDQGLEKIELQVYASNQAARALYERLGFVVEGVRRKGRKFDGRYDDLIQMALFREEAAI